MLIDAVFWRGLFTIIVIVCSDVDVSSFPHQPIRLYGKLVAGQVWLADAGSVADSSLNTTPPIFACDTRYLLSDKWESLL